MRTGRGGCAKKRMTVHAKKVESGRGGGCAFGTKGQGGGGRVLDRR